MKSTSQKRMATPLLFGVAALLLLFPHHQASAQSLLQEHLKTATSASPASIAPEASTSPPSDQSSNGHEDLDATLWVRCATEYKAITRQTFVAATAQLSKAIANSKWTAIATSGSASTPSVVQGTPARPLCVIMDVDETVLDNSAYQRDLILNDSSFSGESWSKFVNEKASPAIAGAKAFVDTCRRLGVKVFFVTNRDFSLEASTRENLISEGLMQPSDPDLILSKNEKPEWTSGKSVRRDSVAAKHRVLLLLGDDLNDFLFVRKSSLKERSKLAEKYQDYWGQRWFMLPNPDYGSWEMAVTNGSKNTTPAEKTRQKMKTLGEQ